MQLVLVGVMGLAQRLVGPSPGPGWPEWGALAALTVAFLLRRGSVEGNAGLYAAGLTALLLVLGMPDIPVGQVPVVAGLGLALHLVLTAVAARWLTGREDWVWPAATLQALLALVLATGVAIAPLDLSWRLTAPAVVALLAAAVSLWVPGRPGLRG